MRPFFGSQKRLPTRNSTRHNNQQSYKQTNKQKPTKKKPFDSKNLEGTSKLFFITGFSIARNDVSGFSF